ncbi:MAG: lysophospholipid acyltransferase family protein [Thermodesulfovibrionales bacterium]
MNYLIYQISKIVLTIFFKVFNRLEIIGYHNVPDKGGFIVAANHVSYLDPPVIGVALKRKPIFIAKEELFKIPFIGAFIKYFSFQLNRNKPQPSTIKEAISRLKNGEVIVLFPEGGRSADGNILDPKRGVGLIAMMSGSPVVPVLIEGTDNALPVGAKFIRPAKIKVIFGKYLKIERKEAGKQFQEKISREIMERIKELKERV